MQSIGNRRGGSPLRLAPLASIGFEIGFEVRLCKVFTILSVEIVPCNLDIL